MTEQNKLANTIATEVTPLITKTEGGGYKLDMTAFGEVLASHGFDEKVFKEQSKIFGEAVSGATIAFGNFEAAEFKGQPAETKRHLNFNLAGNKVKISQQAEAEVTNPFAANEADKVRKVQGRVRVNVTTQGIKASDIQEAISSHWNSL